MAQAVVVLKMHGVLVEDENILSFLKLEDELFKNDFHRNSEVLLDAASDNNNEHGKNECGV